MDLNVTISDLLDRATPYDEEHWPAPLDPRLRLFALISGPAILICLIPYLPWLMNHTSMLVAYLGWMSGTSWIAPVLGHLLLWLLALVDIAAVITYVPLLASTDWLREGRAVWHRVAFAEGILGACHAFVLAVAALAAAIAAVIFVIVAVLVGMAVILALLGGGGSSE